jgi:hypothetical protein
MAALVGLRCILPDSEGKASAKQLRAESPLPQWVARRFCTYRLPMSACHTARCWRATTMAGWAGALWPPHSPVRPARLTRLTHVVAIGGTQIAMIAARRQPTVLPALQLPEVPPLKGDGCQDRIPFRVRRSVHAIHPFSLTSRKGPRAPLPRRQVITCAAWGGKTGL